MKRHRFGSEMKRRRLIYICLLVAALAIAAAAQTETLTNAEIIAMTRAGVPADIVIRKIRISNARFDVSANGLIELKSANVADEVISEMIDRQNDTLSVTRSSVSTAFSDSDQQPNSARSAVPLPGTKREALLAAKTIAIVKSSIQPSRQALEKELLKRPDFQKLNLTIERYRDSADLYVEIGYVSLSWLTHRYVYRIYDRRSGAILAAGETTSWGSLAENLARHIAKSLNAI